jgi:hypothetical protein
MVALGEKTEEQDSIGHGGKVGVKAVLGAKGRPDRPEVVSGVGVADTQALTGLFLSKAECTAESIAGLTVTICQGSVCG